MLATLLLAAAAATTATSQEEYDRRFIGFDDFVMVKVSRYGSSSTPDAEPYQGKFKKPLPGAALYEAIGRDDLATSYRQRTGVRVALFSVAGIAFVAGAVLCATSFSDDATAGGGGGNGGRFMGGLGLAGGAVLLSLLPFSMSSHPIPLHERRALADEYNRALRAGFAAPQLTPVAMR